MRQVSVQISCDICKTENNVVNAKEFEASFAEGQPQRLALCETHQAVKRDFPGTLALFSRFGSVAGDDGEALRASVAHAPTTEPKPRDSGPEWIDNSDEREPCTCGRHFETFAEFRLHQAQMEYDSPEETHQPS